ncbi:Ycf51 family protein [Capilliphycus salinus ALCB114379]|uniref:Ycf51 family protein n=1 Tax=Capilliphycus salinus TaxID=2768948 RepID=UPI0039A70AA6
MLSTAALLNYSKWIGFFTLFCAFLTVVGFIFKWGIRFRLVGVTAFMGVLTGGVFALGLGLFNRVEIPGAVRYARVYDDGGTQIVIAVASQTTPTELEATLQQAAADLFSPGRSGRPDQRLTIRARTLIHPEAGVSEPVFLGQVRRSNFQRDDQNLEVDIYLERFAHVEEAVENSPA